MSPPAKSKAKAKAHSIIQSSGSVPAPNLPVITPKKWLFRTLLSERGKCAIKQWLTGLSIKGRARFDRSIDQLISLPKQSWSKPNPTSKIGDNVYVIRVSDENRMQHRIYGHFSKSENSFVMTFDGYEKDNVYYPQDYIERSEDNKEWCDAEHEKRSIICKYTNPRQNASDDASQIKHHSECSTCVCDD